MSSFFFRVDLTNPEEIIIRLTNCSPFIENEDSPDLRSRIVGRRIDWSVLSQNHISEDGEDFIKRLLDLRPDFRMTLADGRTHAWLAGYGQMQDHSPVATSSIESVPPDDRYHLDDDNNGDPVGHDFQQMGIGQSDTPSSENRTRREGSRNLQRRSHILADAAGEDGPKIMEPSPEMILNSQAQELADENYVGFSRGGKRKPANTSLDAMPEDEEWDTVNRPLDDGTSRKKGKGDPVANPRSVRGTRATRGDSNDEDAAQKVRRSSRQTYQKTARRS